MIRVTPSGRRLVDRPHVTLPSCDAGLKAISAGARVADPNFQFIVDLYPADLDTWAANVFNDSGPDDATTTLFVICGSINTVTIP